MVNSEFLNADELAELTGYTHIARQKEWLDRNGWAYVVNAAGRPIVGRWFARLRLAGVQPTASGAVAAGQPNFAALD